MQSLPGGPDGRGNKTITSLVRGPAAWFLLFLMLLGTVSCGPDKPEITVKDAWARAAPGSAANAAFYMDIFNDGNQDDALIGAESPACGEVQLHESAVDDRGIATMQRIDRIPIRASGSISLEIGGLHIMCLNKQIDLASGERIPLTLIFDRSGELMVELEVREQRE